MSGHAYFGANKDKIRHISLYKDGEFKKIRNAYLYKDGIYQRVWTGASIVTYYDGEDIMGVEEVDEGADALHPSFSTAKAGYTLYGWKLAPDDQSRVEQKLATGEPFSLYAYYVPNTIVICASSRSGSGATVSIWNPRYINGSAWVKSESYGQSIVQTASFYIALNEYQNSTIRLWTHEYTIDEQGYGHDYTGSMGIDSYNTTQYHDGDVLYNWSGNHTMRIHAFPNWGNGERFMRSTGGLANVTLSNPIAWE